MTNNLQLTLEWNPGPDAVLVVTFSLLFIYLTLRFILRNKNKDIFSETLGYVIIGWNIISIYTQLFAVYTPISNEVGDYIYYSLWILILLDILRINRKKIFNKIIDIKEKGIFEDVK